MKKESRRFIPLLYKFYWNTTSIWRKSDLYLRYRIEDLITPHYWSCSCELCMNFVVCILRLYFDQSHNVLNAVHYFCRWWKLRFCGRSRVLSSDLAIVVTNTSLPWVEAWTFLRCLLVLICLSWYYCMSSVAENRILNGKTIDCTYQRGGEWHSKINL